MNLLQEYRQKGFVVINNMFSKSEISSISNVCDYIMETEDSPGKWMKYYETSVDGSQDLLGRAENLIDFFPPLMNALSHKGNLISIMSTIIEEQAILFKEKINYRLSKSNAYPPHQDAPAWSDFKTEKLVSAFIAIDHNLIRNGCMQLLSHHHTSKDIYTENYYSTLEESEWIPIELKPGDVLIFDEFTPHKSEVNNSDLSRRCIIATYNSIKDGNLRNKYFQNKRKEFPPLVEKIDGKDYSSTKYNYNNPFK